MKRPPVPLWPSCQPQGRYLAFHTTRVSNGPVEGLNSIIKKLKRIGAGFRRFENYRCRILLACGNINWALLNPAQL